MSGSVDVLAVMDRVIASRPNIAIERAIQGRPSLARDLIEARAAVAELIGAAKQVKRAYWLARNSAAGLTNYCEESGSTRRCERELAEAESIYHASGFDTALANVRSKS